MKVLAGDRSYWMVFNYQNQGYAKLPNGNEREIRSTTCIIYDDTVKGSPKAIGGCSSTNDSRDNFVKETGRKLSLNRTLQSIFPRKDEKEVRQAFWNVYNNRKSK